MKDWLQVQVINVLQLCRKEAHIAVSDALEAELNYIFTNDFYYLSGKTFSLKDKRTKIRGDPMVQEIKSKIEHYFKLVVRAARDNIPKLIGYFLVKSCYVYIRVSFSKRCSSNCNKAFCKIKKFWNLFQRPLR